MEEGNALTSDPESMSKPVLCTFLLIVAFTLMSPSVGDAQVATDITSSGLNTQVNQVGNSYNITGGARPGGGPNLFHSFGQFDVGQTAGVNDIANFLNNTGLATSNILGRVTGGNMSNIYGTIQTTGFGGANLFLMNPSGIVLGPSASLNIGGSVSFTTAQYLRLFDGVSSANFYANPANDGSANNILTINPSAFEFLSASPAAYGFLTAPDPNATITVQGSILKFPEGRSLSLVGGNITVQSGTNDGTTQAANLQAPGGRINLVSVASPGEVLLSNFQPVPNINGASFTTMGTVTLKEGSILDVSGQFDEFGTPIGQGKGGTVLVRGGQLVMEASRILASTVGTVDGASTAVDIQISQKAALTTGSAIFTQTFGTGRGGDVQLRADTMTMDTSTILTGVFNDSGGGIAGDVVLSVREVGLMGGSSIQSENQGSTPGLGHGNVTIQGLQGTGSAAESVTLSGGSKLMSTTFNSGDGGDVAITARSLRMEGPDTTINAATNAEGHGGDIVVRVQRASLLEGATIKTQTGSADLNAPAAATVTVQGLNGRMADSVTLSGPGSGIVSETSGGARSGHVTVESNSVSLRNGAVIQTGVIDFVGAAGDVTINAGSVDISSGSRISSRSSAGDAGQVAIKANTLTLDNVSIETSTTSSGRGGDVALNVGTVNLLNGAKINSSTANAGRAGDITMNVGSLTMANQSEITSSSLGTEATGDAGNITIQSGSTVQLNDSSITTEAEIASGGQITINAPQMIRLTNSRVSTSVKDGTGGGGNISVDPDFVVLKNSQILAQAFAGDGGDIEIVAGLFLADPSSLVDASSDLGLSGRVQINAAINNLSSVVGRLPESLVEVSTLLRAACAARVAQGQMSSFVERGRDSIPAGPDGLLAGPYLPITSTRSAQRPAGLSIGKPGIQLRRLFGQAIPSSVTLMSGNSACSS